MIPVLFTTYNRLEFTKQSLAALFESDCGMIHIVDNGSTDGTREWLRLNDIHIRFRKKNGGIDRRAYIYYLPENTGVAGAMNFFLSITKGADLVAKVDNDTIVPRALFAILEEKIHRCNLDMVQAKHSILRETYPTGFDEWVKTMPRDQKDPTVFYHHFIGGSGIVFRRSAVDQIPVTRKMLQGWRKFQTDNECLRKAFTTAVSVELLDMKPEGGSDYSKFPEYYKQTGRV